MKNFYNKGITLMEVLTVVAIIGIISAIVLPGFSKIKERQAVKNSVEEITSTLNKARSQSMASLDLSEYGVHFDSNQVVLFKGTVFSVDNANNQAISITSPATLTSTFSGGNVYFKRLNGLPSAIGSVTVSSPNSSKVISVSSTGAISN